MTLCRLHIALCLLALLLLTGCRKEEDTLPADSPRTLTLDLGITLTRATKGEDTGDNSRPQNLMLWIFNGEEKLFYENITGNLDFSITDMNNKLVQTIERIIEVESGIQTLHFYIVMNTDGLSLDGDSTPDDIETATFKYPASSWKGDNLVPLYGEETLDVSRNHSEYSISIEAKRAVGKLELFFTKESASSYLKINSVSLDHVPDKGYLNEEYIGTDDRTYTGSWEDILSAETLINQSLPETQATIGNFSSYETTNFTRLNLTHSYLLENPKGGTWTETLNDYTYTEDYDPEKQADNDYTDGSTRYKLTVNYQTSETGTAKTQVIYLPKIVRNEWNKVFARVKDDGFIIALNVLPWEDVEKSQIGWEPEIKDEGNAPMAAWRLVKINKNDDVSPMKIDPDHKDATNGDEEATCCYVLYPRYGKTNGKSDHTKLTNIPSYAAFYFCMKEPAGAIWEAYITNTEDFRISTTGKYTYSTVDEKNNITGTYTRYCAATGIARDEPYQIQVTAVHPWTYATDPTDDEDNQGTDSGWNDNTPWGERIERNGDCYDIHTDLYIRVSIDGGKTWNYLEINKPDRYINETYWKKKSGEENRRFAGGDKFIRIWQLKAEEDQESFVQLVENLKKADSGQWAILDYWKGEN